MVDWEDLHHFATLARLGSLGAAGRALGVDRGTVSRRIAALEASLGLKLVERQARLYTLTTEGSGIARLAAEVERCTLDLERVAHALAPGCAGELTISAPPSVAAVLIAPRLGAFRERYPDIRLRLLGDLAEASLARREADVAVRLSRPTEGALVSRKIGQVRFGLYASPKYLEKDRPGGPDLIGYDEDLDGLPQQRRLMALAGPERVVLRTNDLEAQRAAARAGLGIVALPEFMGETTRDLQRLQVESGPVTRDAWLVVHADMRSSPGIRVVMDFLAGCFRAPGEQPV